MPGEAYVSSTLMVATVNLPNNPQLRWRRSLQARGWTVTPRNNGWRVEKDDTLTIGPQGPISDDDTNEDFNDPTPFNNKIYSFDKSGANVFRFGLNLEVGAIHYIEKAFVYTVEKFENGAWVPVASTPVRQVIAYKRVANGRQVATVPADYRPLENDAEVGETDLKVSESDLKRFLPDNAIINLDPNAND
jgi:hypothetical protein